MGRRGLLDDIDLRLIELLKQNSRESYTKLARELGVSESTVRSRLRRLCRIGVIKKFTLEYEIEGEVEAFVLVKTSPQSRVPEVSEKLLGIKGVYKVCEVTGENDILVMLRAPSIDSINECIDRIRGTSGVAETNTMIVLRSWVR